VAEPVAAGAANSLHQTLFYLRRDINPYFNESTRSTI